MRPTRVEPELDPGCRRRRLGCGSGVVGGGLGLFDREEDQ